LDDIAETKDRLFKWLVEDEGLIGSVNHKLGEMYICATSDGKPWVEPEVVIDDKWAAVWPRRWVMVRDSENVGWCGPQRLFGVSVENHPYSFTLEDTTCWMYCRPATPEEIEKVEPQPEPESKAERVDEWRKGVVKRTFEESSNGIDEVCQKRFRDLAIDAAVHRLIMAKHPTLTQIEIQRRSRIDSMRGCGYYTVFFDDRPVATVSLSIESPRRFAIEIHKSTGDKP
jgi:hypothetical protein